MPCLKTLDGGYALDLKPTFTITTVFATVSLYQELLTDFCMIGMKRNYIKFLFQIKGTMLT